MNILLSAFACDPNQGSEPGIGWSWAIELARIGHNVTVLTRERHRDSIEAASSQYGHLQLRFIFIDVRRVPYTLPLLGVYPYYLAWQAKLALSIRRIVRIADLSCIQHITYGTYRTPFFLSMLGIPTIFGPVGGGEVSPLQLTKGMSIGARISECARIVAGFLMSIDPMSWTVCRLSTLILVTSEQTRRLVPRRYQSKCKVLPAVTTPGASAITRRSTLRQPGALRILFAGRLLEWKGLHLAVSALQIARRQVPEISLTIVGDGKCRDRLRDLALEKGVEHAIEWISRIPRDKVLEVYDRHDLVILTSLHDSGGTVILEAFARGLPVISLQLGGPGLLVNANCGACIDTHGRSIDQVVNAIAEELIRFCWMSDAEATKIRNAAYDRAKHFSPKEVVGKAYEWFSELSGIMDKS